MYVIGIIGNILCTQYSRARTCGGKRKLDEADRIVEKTLEIIKYFQRKCYFIENPRALLVTRPCMQDLDEPLEVHYCMYGFKYRKATHIWTNNEHLVVKKCNKQCGSFENGRHQARAQRGTYKGGTSSNSLNALYSIPPQLCEAICDACIYGLNLNGVEETTREGVDMETTS